MSIPTRRHHNHRMKNKAKYIATMVFGYTSSDTKHTGAYESIVKNADNLKQCSCEMCRNPRRSKFTKNMGRTLQEIKSELSFRDQIE